MVLAPRPHSHRTAPGPGATRQLRRVALTLASPSTWLGTTIPIAARRWSELVSPHHVERESRCRPALPYPVTLVQNAEYRAPRARPRAVAAQRSSLASHAGYGTPPRVLPIPGSPSAISGQMNAGWARPPVTPFWRSSAAISGRKNAGCRASTPRCRAGVHPRRRSARDRKRLPSMETRQETARPSAARNLRSFRTPVCLKRTQVANTRPC